jgi:serine/threonine-protein kinase
MSPEHVEGQPLDFRTDVFACGIVLYQLTTGRLPFEGKNPHEILKRIAECKFPDPRQVNPRIGNELGKIILRAMAREPKDRYRDVGGFVAALESYVTGSGLGLPAQELARYFQSPATFELALKERLVDHLVRKGKETMPISRPQALEAFDRVLSIDPTNAAVLQVLERMNRGKQWKRTAVAAVGLLLVAGLAFGARKMLEPTPVDAPIVDLDSEAIPDVRVTVPVEDRAGSLPVATYDAAPAIATVDDPGRGSGTGRPVRTTFDAAPTGVTVIVNVVPKNARLSIGGGPPTSAPGGRFEVPVGGDPVRVEVTHDACEPMAETLTAENAANPVTISLNYLSARVTPVCDKAGVVVEIDVGADPNDPEADPDKKRRDRRDARLGAPFSIPFGDTLTTRRNIVVEFIGDRIDAHKLVVRPGEERKVTCAL